MQKTKTPVPGAIREQAFYLSDIQSVILYSSGYPLRHIILCKPQDHLFPVSLLLVSDMPQLFFLRFHRPGLKS